jgi:hypothetical protein
MMMITAKRMSQVATIITTPVLVRITAIPPRVLVPVAVNVTTDTKCTGIGIRFLRCLYSLLAFAVATFLRRELKT